MGLVIANVVVAGGLHLIDQELVAVGPRHGLEVVVADPGHGARPGVVGEERSVGRGHPAGLVARVGAAEALVEVLAEGADDRIAVVGTAG